MTAPSKKKRKKQQYRDPFLKICVFRRSLWFRGWERHTTMGGGRVFSRQKSSLSVLVFLGDLLTTKIHDKVSPVLKLLLPLLHTNSITSPCLLPLSLSQKELNTHQVQRHRHASLYLTFYSSAQRVRRVREAAWERDRGGERRDRDKETERCLTEDGCSRRGGERHPVTKQLLCQNPGRANTHVPTHTHTHAHKVNKEESCLRRVEAGVSERCCRGWPWHTNSSDKTHTHTPTHKQSWLQEIGGGR